MKKRVEDAYILTCNVSLEYEKRYSVRVCVFGSSGERDKLSTPIRILGEI